MAELIVTTLVDENVTRDQITDAITGNLASETADGDGLSLREAIVLAANGDTVVFQDGLSGTIRVDETLAAMQIARGGSPVCITQSWSWALQSSDAHAASVLGKHVSPTSAATRALSAASAASSCAASARDRAARGRNATGDWGWHRVQCGPRL